MPYLQLDTPFAHAPKAKQHLARRFGEIYREVMGADVNRITVAVRDLGSDSVWRCGPGEPRPCALLMCDIRRGRPAETRAELARQLVAACIEILDLSEDTLNVEFTQHAGDEMYHTMYGGLSDEWAAGIPDRLTD